MTELAASTSTALDRILAERQAKHRVPGIAAAIARKGTVVWNGSAGLADIETGQPPGPDTQYMVASISKTFTSVQVMALRDAGKLSLDDPLEQHIPESKHAGVTIRQLLVHVSGMQREPVGDVWDKLVFPGTSEELLTSWNEAERVGRPHDRWHYSNLGFSLLGEVAARIEGKTWYDALKARVLDPLGLRRTTLGIAPTGPSATGYYVPPFTDVPAVEPSLSVGTMAPCGGLASTTTDLTTWAQFLAEGNDEVLSKDTLDEMCQVQTMADRDSWVLGWGLGLMLVRSGERVYAGHTGGWPGSITGMFVHRPSGTAGAALMNNSASPDPAALVGDLLGEVLDNDPLPPEPWTAGTSVPPEFAGLLGIWYSEGGAFTFSVRNGELEIRADKQPESKPPAVFTKLSSDVYRTRDGREVGEILRITRDSSGTPVRLHWATYLFTREPYAFGEWLTSD